MIRFPFRAALVVLPAAFTAAACGGSSSSSEGPPLKDLPAQLAKAVCDVSARCYGNALPASYQGSGCVDETTLAINESDFSLVQGVVDQGHAKYDSSQVQACLDAIRSAGCDALTSRLTSLCGGVISGSAKAGDPCSIGAECAKGLFCKTSAACPGTCTAYLGAGQDCTKDDECNDGLVCANDTRKCTKPAGKGATCGGTSGSACAPSFLCAGGTATASGTCKAAPDAFSAVEGAACDLKASQFCKNGLVCALVKVTAGATGAVTEFQCEKPATGTTCHVAAPESCPTGQFCELGAGGSVEGTCKPLPGDGEPCAKHVPSSQTDALCKDDTACIHPAGGGAGTCRALAHLGKPCTDDAQCYSKVCKSGGCAPAECEPK